MNQFQSLYTCMYSVLQNFRASPYCIAHWIHTQRYISDHDCLYTQILGHQKKTCNQTQPHGLDLQAERQKNVYIKLVIQQSKLGFP